VDDNAALTPRTITVVNPDLGTGTSAGAIVEMATPPPGAPVGLAPSKTSSSPPTAPTLSGLTPPARSLGSSVTLTGPGLSATLTFGGTAADITITGSVTVSPDGTTITVPISISQAAALGARSVTVSNPGGGTATLANAFSVTAPQVASFQFAVQGADPSLYLPAVNGVSVTLDSTGKCTAKTITPQPVPLTITLVLGPGVTLQTAPPTLTLSLTSSAIPGTATNEDCELGLTPTNDFSFS